MRACLTIGARALGRDETVVEADVVRLSGVTGVLSIPSAVFGAKLGEVTVGPDATLHAFAFDDGVVVLSTSVALSQRIVAAPGALRVGPAARTAQAGDAWSLVTSGPELAELLCWGCSAFSKWLAHGASDEWLQTAVRVAHLAEAMPVLGTLIGPVRFTGRADGVQLRGEGVIHFGPPAMTIETALAELRAAHDQAWPEDQVFVGSGSLGHFHGLDGPFRFAVARDGRFETRVDHERGTGNAWDGTIATTWSPELGSTESRGHEAQFSRLWASVLTGEWAELDATVERRLVGVTADEFEFELTVDGGHCVARVRFDRAQRGVTWMDTVGHRPHVRIWDPVIRFGEFRAAHGRRLPHLVAIGVASDSSELVQAEHASRYEIEQWSTAPIASETFRLDSPGRASTRLRPGASAGLQLIRGSNPSMLLVPVRLGTTEAWFQLRPWSSVTFVDAELLTELGARELRGDTGPRFVLDSMELGPLAISSVTVGSERIRWTIADRPVRGVLGIEHFAGVIAELDTSELRLVFHEPGSVGLPEESAWRPLGRSFGTYLHEIELPAGQREFFELRSAEAASIRMTSFSRNRLPRTVRAEVTSRRLLGPVRVGDLVLDEVRVREAFWWTPFMMDSRFGGVMEFDAKQPRRLFVDVARMRYSLR